MRAKVKRTCAITIVYMPYSWKYWRSLNLVVLSGSVAILSLEVLELSREFADL